MKYKQLILIIIFVFLLSLGISFAYFTASIDSEEADSITVTGGKMSMAFDGGNSITVSNIIPDDNPIRTKTFTVTGNNTTELDMGYSLYLVVDENTFSSYAIQYKLISENTGESGTVLLGNEELIGIKTGASKTLLGYGIFDSPTDGAKVHTYDLEIYFSNQRFNQNEDQEKNFKAHIKIEDYILESDRLLSSLDQYEKISRMSMYSYYISKLEEEYYRNEDRYNASQLTELASLIDYYDNLGNLIGYEIGSQTAFLNTTILKEEVESIEFVDTNIVPVGVLGSFDVSEKQNGSVMLWYEPGNTEGLFKITIGQDEGVKAPIHSDFLFAGLNNLASLSGNFITSDTKTMSFMFTYAGATASTFISDVSFWNTSNVTDMTGMFTGTGYGASSWTLTGISNWNTSNVTDMTGMFTEAGYNADIFELDLSNWNTTNATTMSGMFAGAGYNATDFNIGDLSNWGTSNVTDMSGMFYDAGFSSATWSLGNLSNWNVSNVTDMSVMFMHSGYGATSWTVGDLSSWDTSNVEDMRGLFESVGTAATNWTVGDLSNWNVSKVTNMSGMFYHAGENATNWTVGNLSNWNVSNVDNMRGMFNSAGMAATSWTVGNLSNWDVSNVTDISYIFKNAGYNDPNWTVGNLSNWDTSQVNDMKGMFTGAGYNATDFNIGDLSNWDTSEVTEMESMFSGAGYNSTTWNAGNIGAWNISRLSHSVCEAISNLGVAAQTSLAEVRTQWSCS